MPNRTRDVIARGHANRLVLAVFLFAMGLCAAATLGIGFVILLFYGAGTGAILPIMLAIVLGIGSSLFAWMSLWALGKLRTTGTLHFEGARIFVPHIHWWDPSACLLSPEEIVEIVETAPKRNDDELIALIATKVNLTARSIRSGIAGRSDRSVIIVTRRGVVSLVRDLCDPDVLARYLQGKQTPDGGGDL